MRHININKCKIDPVGAAMLVTESRATSEVKQRRTNKMDGVSTLAQHNLPLMKRTIMRLKTFFLLVQGDFDIPWGKNGNGQYCNICFRVGNYN